MPTIKRRQFLQFAGSTLATLGLSQLDIQRRGQRYAQVLAQGTPRKLALLVGINAYPETSQFAALQGCVMDVELQRQLLIHRFGFKPADILTLTDAQATRQAMLSAFEEHLIKQAKPGDVVVFHYSGHGSQVTDPDKDNPDGLNSTFVPVDSALPKGFPDTGGAVKDIMGHTLFLLMSAVPTENLTVVLDSCHSGGGTRGNLRVRSRSGGNQLQASPTEFEYQKQWLSRLNLSPAEYIQRRKAGIAKGVVIASAKRDQLAADAPFSDFYAGAFTYLMTQYLWQQTGTAIVSSTIPNIARSTTKVSSSEQEPQYEYKPGNEKQPLYFTQQQIVPAEAVITKVSGDVADLWLGGLSPESLAAFDRNAILAAADAKGSSEQQVRLESRTGLTGRGKLLGAVQPGTLLQEQVRGIPTDLNLRIGLDPSLGQDTEPARQALQQISRIQPLPLQQGEVQYIFGRITQDYYQELKQNRVADLPAMGSLGLFSQGLDLVPGSFGVAAESITDAVNRLQAKLKSLLAARLVKLTLNANSSRLNLVVSMAPEGNANQLIANAFTVRGIGKTTTAPPVTVPVARGAALPLRTPIQFRITNHESRDVFVSVLVIDSAGEMAVVFPNQWTASADVMRVSAGQTIQIPSTTDSFKLVTQEPKGSTEVLIVASGMPLGNSLKALQRIAASGGQSRGPVALSEPTDVVSSLLDDLDAGTRSVRGTSASVNPGVRSVDTTQLAAMSITFEVV